MAHDIAADMAWRDWNNDVVNTTRRNGNATPAQENAVTPSPKRKGKGNRSRSRKKNQPQAKPKAKRGKKGKANAALADDGGDELGEDYLEEEDVFGFDDFGDEDEQ